MADWAWAAASKFHASSGLTPRDGGAATGGMGKFGFVPRGTGVSLKMYVICTFKRSTCLRKARAAPLS